MPSERPRGRFVRILRSQGLGVICGQATVLLLGVGSVVLVATREGVSQDVHGDDIRAFFDEPSLAHLWFYLVAGVLALYALNTLLCTWDNVLARWRAGMRTASAYAAAVVHVSFLLALLAHLVGGVWGGSGDPVAVGSRFVDLGEGRAVRLTDFDLDQYPNGQPKAAFAHVEIREATGETHAEVIGYNQPYMVGIGRELLLLSRFGRGTVVLSPRSAPGNPIAFFAGLLMILGIIMMGRRWAWPPRRS